MSEAYVGEIRLFPYNFAPAGWLECNGQTLPISAFSLLYGVIGATYGGTQTTFNLPNLQACVPLGAGQGPGLSNYDAGDTGGAGSVTLTQSQIPAHNHGVSLEKETSDTNVPTGNYLGMMKVAGVTKPLYVDSLPNAAMAAGSLSASGGNQPHENRQPFLAFRFCIATDGEYPPRP